MVKTRNAKPRQTKLKLTLLGLPEVWLGSVIKLRTRKTLALLAYLALEPGLHSREKLTALLWPDSDQGRTSLRSAVADLNSRMGNWLLIQRESLGLKMGGLELDAGQVEVVLNQPNAQETDLERALHLFGGDLLEGFDFPDAPEFDDWLLAERQVVPGWQDSLLERLANLQSQTGKFAAALENAQQRLRLEPLNEAAHRQVIGLHLQNANRAAALEAYQTCRQVLQRELGLEPEAATLALVEQTRTSQVTALAKPVLEQSNGRLSGRVAEWDWLEAAWQTQSMVLLSGEPGVGKSRLLGEFFGSKGSFERFEGRPGDAGVPYSSLARLARKLIGSSRPTLEAWITQELTRLLPELGETPPPLQHDQERLRFFQAVVQMVQASTQQQVALVADDVQFFDAPSLEWLVYWAAQEHLPLRLALAYRTGELGALEPILRSLLESGQTLPILLQPLDPAGLGELLQSLELPFSLSDPLHRFTGGNPLFVLETVRALKQQGGLETLTAKQFENRRRVYNWPRSPKVQAIIGRRLERLSPQARDLGRVAALMGEYFDLELAAKVLEKGLLETAQTAEELQSAQVLRGTKFSHDLIFETVLENIPESLARILHGRVLDALEGEAPAAVLAKHALMAGRSEAAIHHNFKAGKEAFALFALLESAEHLEQIRELASASPELWTVLTERERYQVYDYLRSCYWDTGLHRPDLEERVLAEMTQFGYAAEDASVREEIQEQVAWKALIRQGESGSIVRLLQARVEQNQKVQDRLKELEALWHLGWVHYYLEDNLKAIDFYTQALKIAQDLGDSLWIGRCIFEMAVQNTNLGNWQEAEDHYEQSFPLLPNGEPWPAMHLRWHRAFNHLQVGRYQESVDKLQACLEYWLEVGDVRKAIYSLGWIGVGLLEQGKYGQAASMIHEGDQLHRSRSPLALDLFSIPKALVQFGLGQLETAQHTLEQFKPRSFGLGWRSHPCSYSSLWVGLYAHLGKWDQACSHAVMAFEARERFGSERFAYSPVAPRWLETEALLRGDRKDLANEGVKRLEVAAEPYPRLCITYLRSRAVLEAWENRIEKAVATLEQARNLALELALPSELWQIEAKLAELLGGSPRAIEFRVSAIGRIQNLAEGIEDLELKRGFLEFAQKQTGFSIVS